MLRLLNNTRFIWLPIPLLLAAMAILWAADLRTAHESPLLLLPLNFLCTTLASVLVVILIGKSFIRSGAPGLLMLGCGVIILGRCSDIRGRRIGAWDQCHRHRSQHPGLACGDLPPLGRRSVPESRTGRCACRGWHWRLTYAGTFCLSWLVDVLTMEGMTPLFFVQGHGGTPVRQFVLGSAIVMFGISGC